MENKEWIKKKLQACLDNGSNKFAVAPMGKNGRMVREMLEQEMGIKDSLYLDNMNYDGKSIYPVDREENWNEDYRYIITAQAYDIREALKEQFLRHVEKRQIIELFSDDEIEKRSREFGKTELDFLCVGFPKCGTTSLWGALSQNPCIFLPSTKETFFVSNIYNPSAHIRFRNLYADTEGSKLKGGVEPAYFQFARETYLYFGHRLKVLFCVRNPIKAVYSMFKMSIRDLQGNAVYYLKKYEKEHVRAFDEWVDREDRKEELQYWKYIQEFVRYFGKKNVKIIIWEELLKDTERIMEEVQQFIGLNIDKQICYKEMPHMNAGNMMPKNLACAYLNQEMMRMVSEQEEVSVREEMLRLWGRVKVITNEEYNERMSNETEQKLCMYYEKSVEDLGLFVGKDLVNMWLSK